jgi:hypothetical protein
VIKWGWSAFTSVTSGLEVQEDRKIMTSVSRFGIFDIIGFIGCFTPDDKLDLL